MDKHNVEFYFHSKKDGYPAGSWGEYVFEALLHKPGHTPKGLLERFNLLVNIYQVSDSEHGEDLDRVFGLATREPLISYWNGSTARDNAILALTSALGVLPFLLFQAFPDVREAILDYASNSAPLKWLWASTDEQGNVDPFAQEDR